MQSRRDQVQAQSSVLGRLSRALVAGDPDLLESPTARVRSGSLAGLLAGCLVMAGFGVYGLVRPGGSVAWRKAGTLIVEKETGTRYVLDGEVLRPVLNYASARLILGQRMTVKQVPRASLARLGHGEPVGTVGAPDALPAPASGAATSWTACALPPATGGNTITGTALELSRRPAGRAVGAGQGIAVVGSDGTRYLIVSGRRHRLTETWLSRMAGFNDNQLIPVTATWLRAVADGPDLTPVPIPGAGRPIRTPGGRQSRVGELFAFSGANGDVKHYLLLEDGSFAPLTPLAFQIAQGDPRRQGWKLDAEPTTLDASALAGIRESTVKLLPDEVPDSPLTPVRLAAGEATCVRFRPGGDGVAIVVSTIRGTARPPSAPLTGATAEAPKPSPGAGPAVAIAVEPRGGVLAVPGWPGQTPSGGCYLVTDTGVRYPIANARTAELLGYPKGTAVVIPPPLLELLPVGAALAAPADGR